jgi:hypothetical protein
MTTPRQVAVPTSARITEVARQTTSMALPLPIHNRLDELVRLAGVVKPTRAEIVAMLIAEADLEPAKLEERLLRYRRLTVGEVAGVADREVVVPLHGPGRRKNEATE